ncbi:TPA: exosome complex protein Rrp42 [Candidatus Woesearchaeota archaeon]|nr:exosome complex protein Rrp42 [Candidatus Woesearchaeota archaeon]
MIVNTNTIYDLAAQGKRLDGRSLTDYRTPVQIETSISWTAEGSARVQIGSTIVMAGVKLSLEKPYNDTPNEGGITINAELLPLSSSEYESGPPGIKAIELARVVDRGIRESKAIDLKKLCIAPGEKAWFVMVDLITINDAGNLYDVAGLAALAALKSAFFPKIDPETGAILYKEKTAVPLPLVKEPLPITIYKINGKLFVDPTKEEEETYEARLTVASDPDGTLSAIQKGGDMPLTVDEIAQIIDLALTKAAFLRGILTTHYGKALHH